MTRSPVTQFLLFISFVVMCVSSSHDEIYELINGFKATSNPSISSFQPFLYDSTRNFSLGFLRVDQTQLALAIIHVASLEPLWYANKTTLARWTDKTQIFFNGSIVVSNSDSMILWSTGTQGGDRVVLLNSSNLQVQKQSSATQEEKVVWQSFDFPSNTIVENQNFTANMSLDTLKGGYSMRLGDNFIGLYAKFNGDKDQVYWKYSAMQIKQHITPGIPIYSRVNPNGFLGMYQIGTKPVDIQPFKSFNRPVNGFLRVRIEEDGNLKGYNWDGSSWLLDYQAITGLCDLPNPCGSYGLCESGQGCSCLDNTTEFQNGECSAPGSGDFCDEGEPEIRRVRRNGVELPFKELMRYELMSSLEQCEGFCDKNCSCWGAVYNNGSGFCYILDYPIQTLVGVGDLSKVGYFKVKKHDEKKKEMGYRVGFGVMSAVILGLIGIIGCGTYRVWSRRRGVRIMLENEVGASPGPYKDLGSASFKSIEMSNV